MSARRLVARACHVCEWQDSRLEAATADVSCPWCYAPTRIVKEEWLTSGDGARDRAAEFGRIGGQTGGRVRAERLSPRRRREIAQKAAAARWKRKTNG